MWSMISYVFAALVIAASYGPTPVNCNQHADTPCGTPCTGGATLRPDPTAEGGIKIERNPPGCDINAPLPR